METEKKKMERACAFWLCCVPGVGERTIQKLLSVCKTAEEIYRGGEKLWRQFMNERQLAAIVQAARETEPIGVYEEKIKDNMRFLLREDPEYPDRLRNIPDAPFALFVRGGLPDEDALTVAVVGARECSEYGRYVAAELGRTLGGCGVQVISGMARGIDGISQSAALDAGGLSFAVLGSGVDVCYPRENRALYERLCVQGGVLSTYPPGTVASSGNFPPRNRIVSGLADALIVVEARSKSGTLITVDMALEQGKDVYVVPGRVTDRLSDGCNRLLKQGAGVFLSPEDFVRELETIRNIKNNTCHNNGRHDNSDMPIRLGQLDQELQEIYAVLDLQPKSAEQIRSELPIHCTAPQLAAQLMRLCMEGFAGQVTPGSFVRREISRS